MLLDEGLFALPCTNSLGVCNRKDTELLLDADLFANLPGWNVFGGIGLHRT